MVDLAAYVHPDAARALRSAATRAGAAVLTYLPAPGKRGAGRFASRVNSGDLWLLAAWAELAGREPLVSWVSAHRGEKRVRPWRDGAAGARAYLEAVAADPKALGRRTARRYLDRDDVAAAS